MKVNWNLKYQKPEVKRRTTALWSGAITLVASWLLILPVAAADDWRPPPPTGKDGFDWIELTSGEWLKGKIKSMQDEKLEFDSEELDLQEFKWEKIRTVRSPRLHSVWFDTLGKAEGSLLITTNEAFVVSETATNTYPRAELLAITPTGTKEINKWSGKLSAGMNVRSGNTKEVEYSAHALVQRRTPSTHLLLDYLGNYGTINDIETENNQRIAGQFDYFLSRKLFVRAPFGEYFSDPLQNLDHRIALAVGAGYDLIHNRRVEWEITAAPAYQQTRYLSVAPGEKQTANSAAFLLGTRWDVELTRRLDFTLEYRGIFTRSDAGADSHHAVATLEFELHKRLNLDISLTWDRTGNPSTGSDGNTPNKDDLRLILGLGIDF